MVSDNLTVLIVDDEPDICFLLGNMLRQKNYNTVIAHTLTEGLDRLKQFMPALLFLDIHNHALDGYRLKRLVVGTCFYISNRVNHILSGDHNAENRIIMGKWRVCEHDKKLTSIGIRSRVCHGNHAFYISPFIGFG